MGAKLLNELTGEAVLTDKEGRSYHVIFDLSAVMALEKITAKTAVQVISNPGVTDCVAMILAGTAGWQRRDPSAPRVNANLAQRILIDSGGLAKIAPVLAESLSCAEGMGLGDDGDNGDNGDDDGDGGDAGPFASPTS